MTERSYYWIKINVSYLHEGLFISLPENIKLHYLLLYLLACECDAGGALIQNKNSLSIKTISTILYAKEKQLKSSIEVLIDNKFIHYENDTLVISRYMDEQGPEGITDVQKKKREDWRERQNKHRLKVKKEKEAEKELKEEKEKNRADKSFTRDIFVTGVTSHDESKTNSSNNNDEDFAPTIQEENAEENLPPVIEEEEVTKEEQKDIPPYEKMDSTIALSFDECGLPELISIFYPVYMFDNQKDKKIFSIYLHLSREEKDRIWEKCFVMKKYSQTIENLKTEFRRLKIIK